MAALERYYRDTVVWYDKNGIAHRGWSAGPHLFLCKGSSNSTLWDGIFQGTPITQVGVHAGECNDGLGIEDVGDFDRAPWGSDLRALNLGVVNILLDWTDLPIFRVVGHRDCGSPKTCPGMMVDLNLFRNDLLQLMSDPWVEFGDCPPPVDQRVWDFNQRWLERRIELGPSLGCPQYANNGTGAVVRTFKNGIVVDDNNHRGKAWTWEELLRGS